MKKMSVREKVLAVILGILVLFCVYYFVFLIPVTDKIDACANESIAIEDQLILYDAMAAKKRTMEAELEAIFNGEKGNVKELPAYDNSQNVMNQLSYILADAEQYDISFSSVEEEGSTVRRNVDISFTCESYQKVKRILTFIHDGEYRCVLKDLTIGAKEDREGNVIYNVGADFVFFEYK